MTTQEVEEYRHAVQGTLDVFGSVLRDIRDRVLVLSRVAVEAIERAERAERVAEEAKAEANRLAAEAASGDFLASLPGANTCHEKYQRRHADES